MKSNGTYNDQGIRNLSTTERHCIWMKAGVVALKFCENNHDCPSCAFDKEISGKLSQNNASTASWREVMRQPHLQKECRHMLTGRVLFKLCSHNYECKNCAYDQQLYEYDQLLPEADLNLPAQVAARAAQAGGFMAPRLEHCCSL